MSCRTASAHLNSVDNRCIPCCKALIEVRLVALWNIAQWTGVAYTCRNMRFQRTAELHRGSGGHQTMSSCVSTIN